MEGRDRCFEEEKNNTCMDMIRLIQRSHPVAGFAKPCETNPIWFWQPKKKVLGWFSRGELSERVVIFLINDFKLDESNSTV